MTDIVIQHMKFTKLEPYSNNCNTRWRTLPLLSCFKHKRIAVKLPPFTDIHTKCVTILFGTPVNVDWDLTHSTERSDLPRWMMTSAKFSSQPWPSSVNTLSHQYQGKVIQAIVYPEKYSLETEQIYVWNSAHLPGGLRALLITAQVLASTFPDELSSVF